jgi:uncharacterized protein YllA (UPF0747 family)
MRHADELITALYPIIALQEREVGAAYFLLKYGVSVLEQIKTQAQSGCGEHQMIRIGTSGDRKPPESP